MRMKGLKRRGLDKKGLRGRLGAGSSGGKSGEGLLGFWEFGKRDAALMNVTRELEDR